MMIERAKTIVFGFIGTALCLLAWDYWLMHQQVSALNIWATSVAPSVQRLQADYANALRAQEVHMPVMQPTPSKK